jgi:hypothetical protein
MKRALQGIRWSGQLESNQPLRVEPAASQLCFARRELGLEQSTHGLLKRVIVDDVYAACGRLHAQLQEPLCAPPPLGSPGLAHF